MSGATVYYQNISSRSGYDRIGWTVNTGPWMGDYGLLGTAWIAQTTSHLKIIARQLDHVPKLALYSSLHDYLSCSCRDPSKVGISPPYFADKAASLGKVFQGHDQLCTDYKTCTYWYPQGLAFIYSVKHLIVAHGRFRKRCSIPISV